MKKVISILMALVMALSFVTVAFASSNYPKADELNKSFKDGVGPEVDGLAIDYASFEPDAAEGTQYPLVILLHGMGQGKEKRMQLEDNNFSLFASEEMQAKFTNGAAYIFVPRSDESGDAMGTWTNDEVKPLYAAIKDYIAKNSRNIDLTRIYIGGYSMGGKMTIKMISSYPEMFAAAFPMCPAYIPSDAQLEAVAHMPIWMTCSRFDILAGYYVYGSDIWAKVCKFTNVPEDCRFSVMGKVCFGNGKKTTSNHHVWFAICNDMFSDDKGDYPNMVTTDAKGNAVKLEYPNGIVNWMCCYTSDYDGRDLTPTDLVDANDSTVLNMAGKMIRAIGLMLKDTLQSAFSNIKK